MLWLLHWQQIFFPFLGLVTTAASHSSNNLFAYHKMHWRILPAFSIWPLPSHFPCTSTQCITTSTLVSLCIRIASIKCSLTRTNAILKGCAPDFTTCFRTYTYEITFMTQSKCILANTLSLSWYNIGQKNKLFQNQQVLNLSNSIQIQSLCLGRKCLWDSEAYPFSYWCYQYWIITVAHTTYVCLILLKYSFWII